MATTSPESTTRVAPSPPGRGARWAAVAVGLARSARPKQWLKNVLVLVAPAAAGVLTQLSAALDTALAFVAFCCAASGTYLINDARDVTADRAHPVKRRRPVAAGVVPIRLAYVVGGLLLLAGVGVAVLTQSPTLPFVVLAYLLLTTVYSLWLKHVVVLDMVGVAAGFVLRAIAGAAAVRVEASSWFLIVASLGSLFIVAGKREAELRGATLRDAGAATRSTLEHYTPQFLWYVRATTSGALLVSYCLWALEHHSGPTALPFGLSIVPFAVCILRYAMLVDRGDGETPEDLVLSDAILLGSGILVALALTVGIYAF
ncbi:MAG TPA: decaprenyl-phosphate phosphoribosyltransferase [Actinopolymorphaceae bacterium]